MDIIKYFTQSSCFDENFVNKINFIAKTGTGSEGVKFFLKNDTVFCIAKTNNETIYQNGIVIINNGLDELKQETEWSNKQIVDICHGSSHVLALTRNGQCISWGDNSSGQLGYQSKNATSSSRGYRFGHVLPMFGNETQSQQSEVPKISNDQLEYALFNLPQFSRTRSSYPMFGQATSSINQLSEAPEIFESHFNFKPIITSISCGYNHSMVLTESGSVYAFGDNQYKQLGSKEKTGLPQKVGIESIITAISCGGYHCLALNDDGMAFIWGDNRFRQCSSDETVEYCLPFNIEIASKVCQISCGSITSLILTEDKQIYSIGCIECFEANGGIKCTHTSNIIQKPFGEERFIEIASHYSENLFIVKSIDGYCYVWGHTVNGFVKIPNKIEEKRISIAFGILSKNNIIYEPIFLPNFYVKTASTKLNENVAKLFNNMNDFDIIFKFNDKQMFAHKFILKMQCNHYKTLFSENWDKFGSNELEIKDVSYETYYSFIKYLYTECVEVNKEYIYELYDLANSYFEENLKAICLKLIEDFISIENVLVVFSFSLKYELTVLEMSCLQFCSNKWDQLFNSNHFETSDKELSFKFIKRAAALKLFVN